MKEFIPRRLVPHVIAVVALAALTVVSCLLWLQMRKRFPLPEPGSYMGSMRRIFPEDAEKRTRLYVERPADNNDLFFVVVRAGWPAQIVPVVAEGEASSKWLLPVTIFGKEAKLKFIGSRIGPFAYSGVVSNVDTGEEGEWNLTKVKVEDNLKDTGDTEDLRLWLMLRSELRDVEARIAEAEPKIPEQKKEIERLTHFITEGRQLKVNAEAKYAAVKDELKRAKLAFKARLDEAKELEAKIDLSQRVTPMGQLVSLSRESLDRENRWVESMLRTYVAPTNPTLESAISKSERILAIKREIALEKDRIMALSQHGATPSVMPKVTSPVTVKNPTFDSLWNDED